MTEFIDTHTHPYLMKSVLDQYIDRSKAAHISHWIAVAINIETAKKTKALHTKHPFILPTAGIHPCEVSENKQDMKQLTKLCQSASCYAIGEIGLDYHWYPEKKTLQKDWLHLQLDLAKQLNKPVIIHNRKADKDIISITNQYPNVPMVFHCFSSDESFVESTIHANRMYSLTGTITFTKKGKSVRAVKQIPMKHIMLETDCPYLTPKAFKGLENEPAYVPEIAKALSEIKEISINEVARITTQNARQFFHIES